MYETILSPVNYGGLQLKNRIIFAPTTFGLPDEEYLAEIRRLAEGGCAMLIIGDVPVGKRLYNIACAISVCNADNLRRLNVTKSSRRRLI